MSSATVANREEGRDSFSAHIQAKYCGSAKANHRSSRKLDINLKPQLAKDCCMQKHPVVFFASFL